MRTLAPVVAVLASFAVLTGVAEANGRPDNSVTKIGGVPKSVPAGGKAKLKVTVANRGGRASKPARVTVRLGPSKGVAGSAAIGSGRVGRIAAHRSKQARVRVRVPSSTSAADWRFQACVAPAKKANDCKVGKAFKVIDRSSWALLEAAKAAGTLPEGTALLYELYALTGDDKLPAKYRGTGDLPTGSVYANLAASYPALSPADQGAVFPYTLEPRYAQSAWAPAGSKAGGNLRGPTASRRAPDCSHLDDVQGSWSGVEATHAWFWTTPGDSAAKANAKKLAKEFDNRIWPKLTGSFKEVDDSQGAICDPAGDSKLDIYLMPPGSRGLQGSRGVTPFMLGGTDCGPFAPFVIIPEQAPRSTLAHEFMHAIQWRYEVCERAPAWVEGTAAWAEDFVYPNDQREHEYKDGLQLPFLSMLGYADTLRGYQAWTFWYSVYKKDGVAGITRVFDSLASTNFAGSLEVGPSDGLRAAWKRYAIQRWNQMPVGAAGFPEQRSFKDASWDSFAAKPSVVRTEVDLKGAKEKKLTLPTSDQDQLSTFFSDIEVTDKKVRHLQFENADRLKTGSVVQAFIKLKSGKWRYEDWSGRGTVSFCRDKPQENVVRLIVASSNALAQGPKLGVVEHKLTAKNICKPPAGYSGAISGTATYDSSALGSGNDAAASWTGTLNLIRIPNSGTGYPLFYQVDPGGGGSLQYTVTGHLNGCEITGQENFPLSELGEFPIAVLNVPDQSTYGLVVPMAQGPADFKVTKFNCADPADDGPLTWLPTLGVPYMVSTPANSAIAADGGLRGSAAVANPPLQQTSSWDLTPTG